MLERLSFVDDPGFPTELGDGEGEDEMHLSEARAELYDAIEKWEHGKDEPMSRFLTPKHGYHAGEETTLDPVEFTLAKVGYLTEISVTYRTGKNESKTFREQVPDNLIDETVKEMLSRRSITYPD